LTLNALISGHDISQADVLATACIYVAQGGKLPLSRFNHAELLAQTPLLQAVTKTVVLDTALQAVTENSLTHIPMRS
jgi:hypothetical protein